MESACGLYNLSSRSKLLIYCIIIYAMLRIFEVNVGMGIDLCKTKSIPIILYNEMVDLEQYS
ncbi:hypothetical protein CLLU_04780 [Clostridium luticellarii]|jgi:hypothetical protein|uniref:Uncharacterized protein n=1 Tax=Clostridium luticellarii TaxID=1691940 RepID=A0A2T0BS33_9CLOT|nr:hypothetical protein CLLU_04780 [Clostridium luticellarii]